MNVYESFPRFAALFDGLDLAFGTGKGSWIKRPPRPEDWVEHLSGRGAGIGIAPLRPDNTVMFAAIDLDEPDFDAAREMQEHLPGPSFVERSRSGNAHVWVFFESPCPAWVAMGILKTATLAAGKEHVEVFPKNYDFSKVKLGSYINLPFHGSQRPILAPSVNPYEMTLEDFLDSVEASKNDPAEWEKKCGWLQIYEPSAREKKAEFGTQSNLHICARHIIETAEEHPVAAGHRAVVYFNLAKALTNWEHCDSDEALDFMRSVNDVAGPDRISDSELRRILGNAERGQFTSTGCDDPVFVPYAHPDCPIANPRSK